MTDISKIRKSEGVSMKSKNVFSLLALMVISILCIANIPAQAAEYPTGPITLINTNAPGGFVDIIGRAFASEAEKYLGKPMVMVHKPGAAGLLGGTLAAKAAPESKPEGNDSSAAASNKTTPVENAIGSETSPAPANEPAVRPGEPSASSGAHDTSNHDTVIAALEQRITAEGLPLDAALELVAGNAQRLLNGTGAAIAVPENDEMVCRASAGRAPAIGVHFRVKTGLTAEAMRSGRVVTCHNTLCDSRVDSELWRKVGIQSTISAPIALSVGGTAVLEVFAAEPNAFTSAHALLLEALSGLVSRMAAGDVNTCSRPATRSSEDG